MALHNRDRSSAFLAANSSDERMPFFCKSARRSILAKMSVSWAVATWEGWAWGAGAGASRGTPSTDTTGNVETLMIPIVPYRMGIRLADFVVEQLRRRGNTVETELGLNLSLNRQVHLALGVVELALLSDQVGLGLLGFGQLGVALLQHVVEFSDLFDLGVNVAGDQALRLLSFCRGDTTALFIDLFGHCGVDGILGGGDLRLLVANGRFAVCDLGLFSGQLVLVPFSGGLDERRRERFRQLDLRSACRAGEGRFSHGSCL
jgi:hypothetical protein